MPRQKIKRVNAESGFVKYLRTSDEDAQAPERSQDAQRRDIKLRLSSLIQSPDLGEYVDNYTGTASDRRNYQKMLMDARQGKFSHVFASTPDRFGRDDVEALRAIDEMTKLGIIVRFSTHPDLDPSNEDDRLYLNILFGMAKRESAVTARRSRGGMLSKLLGGGWSWRAPDGYLNKEIRLTELGAEEQLKHAKYKRWVEIDPDQAPIWRQAWDLLLTDRYSLEDICEKLHERGYRLHSGKPFVAVRKGRGQASPVRIPYIQVLSKAFHNWFYAGWVVIDSDWANIAPKTVKGEWEPIVSTEEFERGLAILAQRNHKPMPDRKYFYLLQGLVYLETTAGVVQKLTCGTPNANRERGGVAYYCIPSSSQNFLCRLIDEQIPTHLQAAQIDPARLPEIRKAYLADIHRFTSDHTRERKALEARQKKLDEKEINLWRAFTDHGMRAQVYESLTRECQDERARLEVIIKQIELEKGECIENLDAALRIISEVADRFTKCDPRQRRAILLQMVERVVINAEGQVQRVEWKPPFSYLQSLKQGDGGSGKSKTAKKAKTSASRAGSLWMKIGAPIGLQGQSLLQPGMRLDLLL